MSVFQRAVQCVALTYSIDATSQNRDRLRAPDAQDVGSDGQTYEYAQRAHG